MKNVPIALPATIAISDQIRLPPVVMPSTPTASVAIWALLMNHSGPRCQSLPCRSLSGT